LYRRQKAEGRRQKAGGAIPAQEAEGRDVPHDIRSVRNNNGVVPFQL